MQTRTAADPTGSIEVALAHAARLLVKDPALAVEQVSEILKLVPHSSHAILLLGCARRAQGNLVAAAHILRTLSLQQPRFAAAFQELGFTLTDMGEQDEAIKALRRAVYLDPMLPDAWRTVADIFTAKGDQVRADAAYAQYIQSSISDPRLMAAAAALVANDVPRAEHLLREHLKRFPTDVVAMRMLAEVAGRLGRYPDAESLLLSALELAPSFHPARHNYAMVLHRQNRYAEALQQIENLLQAEPNNSSHRNLKAVILARIGDYPQSLEIYADVLSKHPEHDRIWLSYGHALASAGRNQESILAYRRAAALQPYLGEAYWALANLKTFRFTDADLEEMRVRIAGPSVSRSDKANFHFAIAKALEDSGRYAESFEHYASGNALRLGDVGHDPDVTSLHVQRCKTLLTAEFFAARANFGSPAADPIFIVGLPRAGSTLIEQILASHSSVEGTMELPNLMSMAARLGGKKNRTKESLYPESLLRLSAEECAALGQQYLDETRIQRKTGRPLFIDKMPNNFLHIGLIRLILPNAKIIDARRHPLACCFSGFKQHFAEGQRFTYSLESIGRYYADYVQLMAHFDEILPGAVHRVIYEQLVDDTEAEVRRLLAYCALPFENSCLRFYENDRAVRTASSQQVRRPIFRDGIDQWRHYEQWLTPLKEALGAVLTTYPAVPEY